MGFHRKSGTVVSPGVRSWSYHILRLYCQARKTPCRSACSLPMQFSKPSSSRGHPHPWVFISTLPGVTQFPLTLVPNRFYRGAGSRHLRGRRMRCVEAVLLLWEEGKPGRTVAVQLGQGRWLLLLLSGWLRGVGMGRESCQWRGSQPTAPTCHQHRTAPWTPPLQAGGFSPTERPAAPIAEASASPSAILSAALPADKGALTTRSHVLLFVPALPR